MDEKAHNLDGSYSFDDVTLNAESFDVQKGGLDIVFRPRMFDVLLYLVRNPGRVVTKQEIFDDVWKDTFVEDNALARIISEIRTALGDNAAQPKYIETVPKRGYRFIAKVNEGSLSPTSSLENGFDEPVAPIPSP